MVDKPAAPAAGAKKAASGRPANLPKKYTGGKMWWERVAKGPGKCCPCPRRALPLARPPASEGLEENPSPPARKRGSRREPVTPQAFCMPKAT